MRIKKKAFSFSAILFFIVMIGNAQFSVAPKIGLSYSTLGGDLSNSKIMPGAFFGGMVNMRLNNNYSFQSGLLLSGKGTTLNFSTTDDDEMLITYLELPLNSVLMLPAGSGFIQVFAGPYFGLAVNGQYRYLEDENNLKEKLEIGTAVTDEIKPLDAGINFGAGYIFEGLEVQLGIGRSFSNISNNPGEVLKNKIVTVSLAYYFGFSSQNSLRRY